MEVGGAMSGTLSVRNRGIQRLMTITAVVLSTAAFASQVAAATLIVQGSSTLNRRLFERHQAEIESDSGHELTIIPTRTMLGLIALMEGRAHLAMVSAPLKNEIATLQKAMPGLAYEKLQAHEITATRVALCVHQSNPVHKMSLDQVRQSLLGKITNWSELGGKNQPIRVVAVGGDGQHDAAVLERFTGPIASGTAELVLGVRPRGARWAEVLFSGYTRWRFGVPDILCGLKGYHMSLYRAHGRFDGTNSVGTELALAGLHGGARTFLTPIPIAPRTGVPRFGRAWRANIRILRAMLAALRMDLRSMLHSGNHEIIPPKWQT